MGHEGQTMLQAIVTFIAVLCLVAPVTAADFKVPIKDGWFTYDGKIELAKDWKVVFILYPDGGTLKLDPELEIDESFINGLRLDKSEEGGPIKLNKVE